MKRKHSLQPFLSLLLLTLAALSAKGQGGAAGSSHRPVSITLAKATRDSLIKNIRAVFHRINTDTTLREVSLPYEDYEDAVGGSPDNGGDATGYFKKDTLCKLVMSFGPSFGMKDYEYYYDRGHIVFIYEKDQHFTVQGDTALNHDSLVVGFEGRFYFDKGKLIAKVLKRNDNFMAEEIDDAYIKELLDVEAFITPLRKQLHNKY